jgi:hypothetical protein
MSTFQHRSKGSLPAASPKVTPVFGRFWKSHASRLILGAQSLLEHRAGRPMLSVSAPEDTSEQEAHRVGDQVLALHESQGLGDRPRPARSQAPRAAADLDAAAKDTPVVADALRSSGRPLDERTRRYCESRFGHDFSSVRVYADSTAAKSARSMNALAYTVGENVVFGAGQYAPETMQGRRTLAHELAHVVQQRGSAARIDSRGLQLAHHPVQVHRKLALTGSAGDVARVIAIMNQGLGPSFAAKLNGAGEVEIVDSGNQGPPTRDNQFFTDRLRSLINEAGTTTVGVTSGGVPIVGSYALSQIDIADIEALGVGQPGWDARAALLHELVEQREKQLGTSAAQRGYGSPTSGAHGQGLAAELGMIGAILESDTGLVGGTANPDGTMNGTRTVVFKYPDGTRYRIEVTLTRNNITGVTRTKLP